MVGLARIYKVNGHYVIADSVEDAVRIFKEGEGKVDEILNVSLVSEGRYPDFAFIETPDK